MTGEDATRRLFIAIEEFRNGEVSKLLNADPGLLDATYHGRSAAELAIAETNLEALHVMREVLVLTQSGKVAADDSTRPSPSRFLRVASDLGEWTEAEQKWLHENPKAAAYENILRAALKKAAGLAMLKIMGDDPSPGSTAKADAHPSPGRVFEVASGLSQWTDEEKAWLKEHPNWKLHEEEMRHTLREVHGRPPETEDERRNRALRDRADEPPGRN